MSLQVLRLEAAPAGWSALLAGDASATATHRPELWQALAAASPDLRPCVLAVERDGELVGGAAVLIERRAGLVWLHGLPHLLSAAPISQPNAQADVDRAVADELGRLQRELRATGGEWACYRAAGEPVAGDALERVGGETRWMRAAVIALGEGPEAAKRGMDRKARQDVARAQRHGIHCSEEPAELEAAYSLHARQSRSWGGHRALPLELSRRLLALGVARLFVARDERGILCAVLALDGGHETLLWWSGTHPAARGEEAYSALLWWTAEWAAAQGRLRLNLGASRGLEALEAFKRSLGATPLRYPVRWIDARHAPVWGRLVAAAQRRVRRSRSIGEAN